MTLRTLLVIVARRWYVVLVVLGGAGGLTVHLASSAAGVYSTHTTVSFLYEFESTLSLDGSRADEDVVAFAGAVAAEVVPGRAAVRYSAVEAPYYGAGLREGVLVGLLDYGNQWTPSYGAAVLDIRIVGPTREWVALRQREALTRVYTSSYVQRQPGNRMDITPRVDPLSLRIEHIAPTRVAIAAAVAALSAAGLLTAGALAVGVDRGLTARAARRAIRPSAEESR
ncbi:hypothetical protein [Microbacterium sp. NPDC096154]|uniref:hypothetical protein n=1 Tax=Microbacterium sp. NPDC096154 TaxID=3155549 RepID=UPI0033316398